MKLTIVQGDTMKKRKGQRRLIWILVSTVMPVVMLLGSCGEEEKGEGGEAGAIDCVSNEQFFLKEVWTPIIEKQCYVCHSPQGIARDTKMVYQLPGQVGFLDGNLNIFKDVASYERGGKSIILLKPSAEIEHGGARLFETSSEEYQVLEEMIKRVNAPVTCGPGNTSQEMFEGVTLSTPQQTLRKATLSLGGRLPTEEERFIIEEAGLQGIDPILDRLMNEDAFYDRLTGIFNDLLLTDKYLGGTNALDLLNSEFYPEATWFLGDAPEGEPAFIEGANLHTNTTVAREPIALVNYVVRNNLPFTEVLTADYMVVNPYSARAYGITDIVWDDPLDPNEYKPGRIAGLPHAGLLSSPMFLNRFPTTDTNRNRHRSRIVYNLFIATDVLKLAERPIDPTSATHNPTMNDPQCLVCHAVVDPVAGAFQNWDDQGNYNPPEAWFGDMRVPGFGKDAINGDDRLESLSWLARRITADQRFDIAVVYIMYRALIGQAPLSLPNTVDAVDYDTELEAYNTQQEVLVQIAREFRANDHNLRTITKSLVRSPYFRAVNAAQPLDEAQAIQLGTLGSGRMLTPEMLNNKIQAITGLPWRPRMDRGDYLLNINEYLILYGGIDSDDVTERITEPNGIMANIQLRMANELACLHTARDFGTMDAKSRIFFKHVEPSYVPVDENGFAISEAMRNIKQNIKYLYWHILSEDVELNGPEVEETYQLWLALWEDGRSALDAEEASANLPSSCQHRTDYWTGRDLPQESVITSDPQYTIRAWMGVMTYLFADYTFLYE